MAMSAAAATRAAAAEALPYSTPPLKSAPGSPTEPSPDALGVELFGGSGDVDRDAVAGVKLGPWEGVAAEAVTDNVAGDAASDTLIVGVIDMEGGASPGEGNNDSKGLPVEEAAATLVQDELGDKETEALPALVAEGDAEIAEEEAEGTGVAADTVCDAELEAAAVGDKAAVGEIETVIDE